MPPLASARGWSVGSGASMDFATPQVYLVGAGPGNPGLLTLRAVECLGLADFVLYDRLVPPRLLDYAPAAAGRLCVEDLPGPHAERGPHIVARMIEAAKQGRRVVRLKGGDPFLFGRGAEEAQALHAAGIPYELVPGVTSGLAAAEFAGIPLTHREHASAVAFVTGHECPGKPGARLDWAALAAFPGTLVFYMGLSRVRAIAEVLVRHGKPAATPAAAVRWGTTGEQQTVEAALADLPAALERAGLTSPALLIVGPVVALRPVLAWAERRPLFGRRVLVTRPRRQAGDMVRRLERVGAVVHVLPAVEVRDPPDWGPVDRALADLASYQWLVFTSANGVHALLQRLRATGRDLRALGGLQLAAIGPGTADTLRAYHLEPDLIPPAYRSESLADALRAKAVGQRILLARADRGRDVLRQELSGVAEVEQVAVYSQVDAVALDAPAVAALRGGEIEFITVTSSNIARALAGVFDDADRARLTSGELKLVSISPVTSAAIRELGWPVAAEADEYTVEGVVQALCKLAEGSGA